MKTYKLAAGLKTFATIKRVYVADETYTEDQLGKLVDNPAFVASDAPAPLTPQEVEQARAITVSELLAEDNGGSSDEGSGESAGGEEGGEGGEEVTPAGEGEKASAEAKPAKRSLSIGKKSAPGADDVVTV